MHYNLSFKLNPTMKSLLTKLAVAALLCTPALSAHSVSLPFTESRLSIEVEYELMHQCVGNNTPRRKAVRVCGCALRMTIENGWGPDYNSDREWSEDALEFREKFRENRIRCQDEYE